MCNVRLMAVIVERTDDEQFTQSSNSVSTSSLEIPRFSGTKISAKLPQKSSYANKEDSKTQHKKLSFCKVSGSGDAGSMVWSRAEASLMSL